MAQYEKRQSFPTEGHHDVLCTAGTEPEFSRRHPYLERVFSHATLSHQNIKNDYADSKDKHREICQEVALLHLVPFREFAELQLSSLEQLILKLEELPADVSNVDRDEAFGNLEYPHMYLILDDPTTLPFSVAVKFLNKQKTLAFKLFTVPEGDSVAFATNRYVFILDWPKLGLNLTVNVIKPLLENPLIHKIVHNFESSLTKLRCTYEVGVVNFFDVVDAERFLHPHSQTTTFRQFQQTYKNSSYTFQTFPDRDFLCTNQPDKHTLVSQDKHALVSQDKHASVGQDRHVLVSQETHPSVSQDRHASVRQWPLPVLEDVLKQVIYLGLIKRCQMSRLMAPAIRETERKMMQLYDYQRDWAEREENSDKSTLELAHVWTQAAPPAVNVAETVRDEGEATEALLNAAGVAEVIKLFDCLSDEGISEDEEYGGYEDNDQLDPYCGQ